MRAFRQWLANKVAPKGVAVEPAPKRPTPLWINRRKAMLAMGYDPRDTANP